MNGPIYMYYQIVGMYQNHRRYVRSHLDQQMASDNTNGNWASLVNDATQASELTLQPSASSNSEC